MPQRIEELLGLFDLDDLGEGIFRGEHPETQMQRSFGGQVLAQALAAAYRTLDDQMATAERGPRLCHSLSSYFLRPGSTSAPIDYHVTVTRDGRGFSTRRVLARQLDRDIFVMSGSFKTPEVGLEHQIQPVTMPTPPESCPPLAEVLARRSRRGREHWEAEWGVLDVRYVDSSLTNPLDTTAQMTVWLKTVDALDDEVRLHQLILAYASDLTILAAATVGHDIDFFSPDVQMATINHTMWFHRHIRADGWVLYEQQSPSASNGLGLSTGRLYGNGVLGASCAQEGLLRVLGESDAPSQVTWLK